VLDGAKNIVQVVCGARNLLTRHGIEYILLRICLLLHKYQSSRNSYAV